MSAFSETVYSQQGKAAPIGSGKFGAQLLRYPNGEMGILKTKPFATDSFRGIPKQEMPRREVAAYVLDHDILDFGVVPETILFRWDNREASVQEFVRDGMLPRDVQHRVFDRTKKDWKYRIGKLFTKMNLDDLAKIVVLDLVMNNVDRHGRNILIALMKKRVWAIDNGLTFGRYYKGYRSIFHKYLYYAKLELPEAVERKLRSLSASDLDPLAAYLPDECIEDTWLRIKFILDHSDRLAYKRMGAARDLGSNKFPSYEEWFKRQKQVANDDMALVYSP